MRVFDAAYERHRRFLWGLCYRMTGDAAEAEDLVHETFVRVLERHPGGSDDELRPWLIRVATNLSIDFLRKRKKTYTGPWLPSPIETTEELEESPAARYEWNESIKFAFLLALEALTPAQRAVLLLRDVFDFSTAETAALLKISVSSAKVTLHRARSVMRRYDRTRRARAGDPGKIRSALESLIQALNNHDTQALLRLMSKGVSVTTDGGGEVMALKSPVRGIDRVVRLITRIHAVYAAQTDVSFRSLNLSPAILFTRYVHRPGHARRFTMHCELKRNGRIGGLYLVFAPAKLLRLDTH